MKSFLAQNGLDPWDAIYIGGGGDGYGLSHSVSNYTAAIGAKNFFTHWENNFSGNEIQSLLRIQDRIGAPKALVGHSWGGPDTISVAQWAKDNGIGIDLLVTVDPVGQPSWNLYAARNTHSLYAGLITRAAALRWVICTPD